MAQDRLHIEHISKAYTEGIVAIVDAGLTIGAGEIHGLLGENGAGKSTFVKIISGALQRDGGDFELDGKPVSPASITQAAELGIFRIQKQSGLVPSLTVAENILLGQPKNGFAPLNKKQMHEKLTHCSKSFQWILLRRTVRGSLLQRMLLRWRFSRYMRQGPKLIILDEPSSYFSLAQTQELSACCARLRQKAFSILYGFQSDPRDAGTV